VPAVVSVQESHEVAHGPIPARIPSDGGPTVPVQANKFHIETPAKPIANIVQLTPRASIVVARIIHNHDLTRQACLACHRQESSLNRIGRIEAGDDDTYWDGGNTCSQGSAAQVLHNLLEIVGATSTRQCIEVDEMQVLALCRPLEDEEAAVPGCKKRFSHGMAPSIILHSDCHGDARLCSSPGPTTSIQPARASWSTHFGGRNSSIGSTRESLATHEIWTLADSQEASCATTYY
jgi:hypothetical protein